MCICACIVGEPVSCVYYTDFELKFQPYKQCLHYLFVLDILYNLIPKFANGDHLSRRFICSIPLEATAATSPSALPTGCFICSDVNRSCSKVTMHSR